MSQDPVDENSYIVVLKKNDLNHVASTSTVQAKTDDLINFTARTIRSPNVTVTAIYDNAIQGFAAQMSAEEAEAMVESSDVAYIEQDGKVYASDIASGGGGAYSVSTWGLDRIDQRDLPLSNTPFTPYGHGSGVTAYIIDTGILLSHEEFGDRAEFGINTSGESENEDCNGHGTHVAGTVAGNVYGVANQAKVVAVKVLKCNGGGTYSGVIAGIDWVMGNAIGKRATANLSLGGGFSQALNDAVKDLHDSGVPVVVAAGNNYGNACSYSPASESTVITVGSTTSSDARSSFSNYGKCVDIMAPGSSIKSAWIGDTNSDYSILSGTSMASPHVCGAVALLLEHGIAPANIASYLEETSTLDVLSNMPVGTPNRLLYLTADIPSTTISPSDSPSISPSISPPTCVDSIANFAYGERRMICKKVKPNSKMCKDYHVRLFCPQTCDACENQYSDAIRPFIVKRGQPELTCEKLYGQKEERKQNKCLMSLKISTTCRATCGIYNNL